MEILFQFLSFRIKESVNVTRLRRKISSSMHQNTQLGFQNARKIFHYLEGKLQVLKNKCKNERRLTR